MELANTAGVPAVSRNGHIANGIRHGSVRGRVTNIDLTAEDRSASHPSWYESRDIRKNRPEPVSVHATAVGSLEQVIAPSDTDCP
jgi:hypothetical protein